MAPPARLLLVDDDDAVLDHFGRWLTSSGYEVDLAEDGYRAMEMVEQKRYDLLLLDYMMEGISGIEVLRKIREKWSASELPVIMVTAFDDSADVVSALRLGANDYLTKPLEFSVALGRIETRLGLSFADREMRRANDFYHLAMRASEEGLWDWDLVSGALSFSEQWKTMLGFSNGEISPKSEEWFSRLHPGDQSRVTGEIEAHLGGHTQSLRTEYRIRHKDGTYRWMENRGSASRDASGRAVRLAGYQTDISTRKTVDPITRLRNRSWLEGELGVIAAEGKEAALLAIDVDRFDRLDESLAAGGTDRVIVEIARVLRNVVGGPGNAASTAVHSGTGQFAVLLRDTSDVVAAERLGALFQAELRGPLDAAGERIFVTATMGIAATFDGLPGDQLLRGANAALRHARERGVRCELFDTAMRQQDLEEVKLVNSLRHAVDRSELVVHYQPKVDLTTLRIAGFEALVRWKRPGYGLVQPNDFILAAERTGLIVAIGRHVLERACKDTAELRKAFPDVGVSVNVSGRQLAETDLVEQVCECIDAAGLEPKALLLEITETFLVEDPEKALLMLTRLRAMGIGLKLDDFGSGYSSLDYLRRFPFDTLKVDRSFVSGLASCHGSAEIVKAIAGLAQSLKMDMVAEGIENQAQMEWLRGLGCRYGQGYWFSPAVEVSGLRALLEESRRKYGASNSVVEAVGCGKE
jgi:PAS domain S-box-containing protein/diguanylate cyclase (GGDEF)-like protein